MNTKQIEDLKKDINNILLGVVGDTVTEATQFKIKTLISNHINENYKIWSEFELKFNGDKIDVVFYNFPEYETN